jgi:hypothetical protein
MTASELCTAVRPVFDKITYLVFSVDVTVLRLQKQDTLQLAAAETLTELTKATMWSQSN